MDPFQTKSSDPNPRRQIQFISKKHTPNAIALSAHPFTSLHLSISMTNPSRAQFPIVFHPMVTVGVRRAISINHSFALFVCLGFVQLASINSAAASVSARTGPRHHVSTSVTVSQSDSLPIRSRSSEKRPFQR